MLTHPVKRSRGLTLVELLVGVGVGLLVVSGAVFLFGSTVKYNEVSLTSAQLEQNLRAAMALMVHDIRRAGYTRIEPGVDRNGDGIIDRDDLFFNPFLNATYDVTVSKKTTETLANSCILFAYNRDEDSPPVVDNNEKFGFRLNNGVLQMRTSATGTTAADVDCDDGTWEAFTEDAIEVTGLTFALTHTQVEVEQADIDDGDEDCGSGNACICIREVQITLTGRVKEASMNDVQQSITEKVRIRNDKHLTSFDTGNVCRG